MSGLTEDGFEQKSLEELKAEIEAAQRADIDPNLDQSPDSVIGQLNAIFVSKLAELWEVAQAVYSASDPDRANGQPLDAVCSLTGVIRLDETFSVATVLCAGTAATSLSIGRRVGVPSTTIVFASTAAATLATADAWAGLTSYSIGDVVRTMASQVYVCITAGVTAASPGPTGEGTDITDGTVHWRWIGAGTAYAAVPFESEEPGPVVANGYALTEILTPVSGWAGAVNYEDADTGTEVETNPALRLRREDLLHGTGSGSVPAVRAAVLKVSGVTSCTVFENTTDLIDSDGIPAHAIEVLVMGGDDADIAAAIWAKKAGGIEAHGSTTVVVTDSQGDPHDIGLTRPTQIDIYISVSVTTDDDYPTDGDDLIKGAYVAAIAALGADGNVIFSSMYRPPWDVAGVFDITALTVDTVTPAVGTSNISIGVRETAETGTTLITVVAT